jgi:hypothetical protein
MTDEHDIKETLHEKATAKLPEADLQVDFGARAPGSANPMPAKRRAGYEKRIRSSIDSQSAGAERASQIFIR